MDIDAKEILTKFRNSIRDASAEVVMLVEGATQQVSESRMRRDKMNVEANLAQAKLDDIKAKIAKLTPECEELEAKVAILKKAISTVVGISL